MPSPSPLTTYSEQELLARAFDTSTQAFKTVPSSTRFTTYNAKTITIPAAQTDYDIAATNQTLFTSTQKYVSIYAKDAAITVKLNDDGNDGIDFDSGEQQVWDEKEITNVFITTTVETIVRIITQA